MENKLKQQLRFRMLGQLSDEKTNTDINNAYSVAVLFTSFVGENTLSYKEGIWRMKKLKPEFKTTEELLNKF